LLCSTDNKECARVYVDFEINKHCCALM
jgi:hypothetical protein